jgi:tripartite-type tricarboxylate transporter receptor subunit TctC
MRRVRSLVVAAHCVALTSSVLAQGTYPTKPMRWVISNAPGGGADVIARPIAAKVSELLGQHIVYENRGGAGGLIAGEAVARANPDGYTFIVVAPNTHIFPQLINKKMPYDPVKDFAMITKFDLTPNVLVAHPGFAPNSPKELIAHARANPGKINFASSGDNSAGHLSILLLQDMMKIDVVHVPYKGAAPAMFEVMSGRNDLVFINYAVAAPHHKSGRLKIIAFCGPKRLAAIPEVPTFDEQGFIDFESQNFKGLAAPAGTPKAIIAKMHETLVKVVNMPDISARLIAGGSIPRTTTPEQFVEENRREVEKWGRVMQKYGIVPK